MPLQAELIDAAMFGSTHRYGDLSMHAVIDVRRTFERREIVRALEKTMADFPVLGCRYETGAFRDRWVELDFPASRAVVVASEANDLDAATAAWAKRPIDPTRDCPIRVVVIPNQTGSRLIVSLLHLVVDGAGFAAVGHVFGAHLYGQKPRARADVRRGVVDAVDGLRLLHLPVLLRDAAAGIATAVRVATAEKRNRQYPVQSGAELTFRYLVIKGEQVRALRERCGSPMPTVNDLLVAAMARLAAARSPAGPATVLYTMDLRRYGSAPRLLATNASSILTALVPRTEIGDLAETTKAVMRVTSRHRRGLAGPAFFLAPLLLERLSPHALIRKLLKPLHLGLVDAPLARGLMFTNVGKLDDGLAAFGDEIVSMRVIGPMIRDIPVPAIVAYGVKGDLHLELIAPSGLAARAIEELQTELLAALEIPETNESRSEHATKAAARGSGC